MVFKISINTNATSGAIDSTLAQLESLAFLTKRRADVGSAIKEITAIIKSYRGITAEIINLFAEVAPARIYGIVSALIDGDLEAAADSTANGVIKKLINNHLGAERTAHITANALPAGEIMHFEAINSDGCPHQGKESKLCTGERSGTYGTYLEFLTGSDIDSESDTDEGTEDGKFHADTVAVPELALPPAATPTGRGTRPAAPDAPPRIAASKVVSDEYSSEVAKSVEALVNDVARRLSLPTIPKSALYQAMKDVIHYDTGISILDSINPSHFSRARFARHYMYPLMAVLHKAECEEAINIFKKSIEKRSRSDTVAFWSGNDRPSAMPRARKVPVVRKAK